MIHIGMCCCKVQIFMLINLFYCMFSWLALARLEAKIGNIDNARNLFFKSNEKCPDNIHILHAWGHLEQVLLSKFITKVCLFHQIYDFIETWEHRCGKGMLVSSFTVGSIECLCMSCVE